jgi:hypothetical protein
MKAPDKKALFGSTRLDEITEPLRAGRSDVLVPFSARLRFSTLQRLKNAAHALGFVEQEFVDAAIAAALDKVPESNTPLPAAKQAVLEKKLRKL